MPQYNLPDGCTQEQIDSVLGWDDENPPEPTEAEIEADYLEAIEATAHLAPPNVFHELIPARSPMQLHNLGLALLRAAANDDEAMVEDCCPDCHSTNVEFEYSGDPSPWCNECAAYIIPLPQGARLVSASHLADALLSYEDKEREVKPREIRALVDHAAMLHLQLAELRETLAAERARAGSRRPSAFSLQRRAS